MLGLRKFLFTGAQEEVGALPIEAVTSAVIVEAVGSAAGVGTLIAVATLLRQGAGAASGTATAAASGTVLTGGAGVAGGTALALAGGAILSDYLPNNVLTASNLRDTGLVSPPDDLTDIQDNPAAPDGNWWTAINPTFGIEAQLELQTPGGELVTEQMFQVYVRKTAGPGTPTLTVELLENGSVVATLLSGANVTSESGMYFDIPWDASLLSDPTGANVGIKIIGVAS